MPSSTSNVEREIPGGPWGRTWLLSILMAAAALASLELWFRSMGHGPCVVDDMALWSLRRGQVYDKGQRTPVALLGSSRMQLGFIPAELESLCPSYRAVQLALDGRWPVAVLQDLARDENFHGLVICDMTASGLSKTAWDSSASYVAYYHNQFGISIAFDTRIKCYLQSQFVLLYPTLRLDNVLLHLWKERALPAPIYLQTFSNRSRVADYSMVDLAVHQRIRVESARQMCIDDTRVPAEQWLRDAAQIEPDVQKIQHRGGQVVFVRFPTSGEVWRLEEKAYPKSRYWDAFAARTSATTVHFRDFPELAGLRCPDLSHLDGPDARVFTRALLKILEDRSILRGRGKTPRARRRAICPAST